MKTYVRKAEQGLRSTEREVKQEELRIYRERANIRAYADWFERINWQLFCTFTFAWNVSDPQADKSFSAFIDRLERLVRSDVCYVRGDEKRFSGCGKPACARHFHVLLTSAAPLDPPYVERLWMEMAGHRSDHAGAKVEFFDPAQNGVAYVLKMLNQVAGDWKHGRLELFHPEIRALQSPRKRLRRHLQRHKARQQMFSKQAQAETNIAADCSTAAIEGLSL